MKTEARRDALLTRHDLKALGQRPGRDPALSGRAGPFRDRPVNWIAFLQK